MFALVHTLLENENENKVLESEHDNRDGNDNPQEVASEPGEPREPDHDPEVCSDGQKDKPVKQVINNDSDRPVIVCNYYKQSL